MARQMPRSSLRTGSTHHNGHDPGYHGTPAHVTPTTQRLRWARAFPAGAAQPGSDRSMGDRSHRDAIDDRSARSAPACLKRHAPASAGRSLSCDAPSGKLGISRTLHPPGLPTVCVEPHERCAGNLVTGPLTRPRRAAPARKPAGGTTWPSGSTPVYHRSRTSR